MANAKPAVVTSEPLTEWNEFDITQQPQLSGKEAILQRRIPMFKWLPVCCDNDLVHGSWYLVAASCLATLIPIFPLISLYLITPWWPTFGLGILPTSSHTAVYALLAAGCGIMFGIGSYLMVRSFSTPPMSPCCRPCACMPNDDVHSLWWFTLGTFTTVPVTAIYVYYFRDSTTFAGALFICCFASVASIIILAFFYPSVTNPGPMQEIISPILHPCCCGPGTRCHPHARNDWLIVCWLGFWATSAAIIGGCVVFIYYAYYRDAFQMYQYGTGVADMVLVLIGNIYYLAGSYQEKSTEEPIDYMMQTTTYSDQQIQRYPPSTTQMTYAQPLPAGWEKGNDPESGSPFYYNRGLGISQWDPPIPPPPSSTFSLNTPIDTNNVSNRVIGASSPVDSIPPQTPQR